MFDHQWDSEPRGVGSAKKKIDIRDGQRATRAETGRPGRRSRGFRPDLQLPISHATDRSATRGNRVEVDTRGPDGRASDLSDVPKIGHPFCSSHIGTGSTHIEADNAVRVAPGRGGDGPDDSCRWPAQQTLGRAIARGLDESTAAGHRQDLAFLMIKTQPI